MPEKSDGGHKIYKGICKECGYVRCAKLSSFKQKPVQTCVHKNLLSNEQLNKWYDENKIQCLCCGKDIPLNDLGFNEYKKRKFCDNNCSATYNNAIDHEKYSAIRKDKKIFNGYCKNCGKTIRYPNKFCSISCQHDFNYKDYIERWKSGNEDGMSGSIGISKRIQRYLREKYNNQCCKCGWHEINPTTGKVPLEVHHKDGDHTNNDEDNLELLCPNCHALTPTYRALNNGNGRKDRYI